MLALMADGGAPCHVVGDEVVVLDNLIQGLGLLGFVRQFRGPRCSDIWPHQIDGSILVSPGVWNQSSNTA